MASAGGLALAKKSCAPHQKNVSMIRNGITDQAISSFIEPWMGAGISSSERRRYLMAKMKTAAKISVVITTVTADR